MPSLTLREYNPTTGEVVGPVDSMSLGRVSAGTHSPVKVYDVAFVGVNRVSSLKVGLVDASGISVPGKFGVWNGDKFDAQKAAGPLTEHFPGLNLTMSANDPNNVEVGMRADDLSNFICIDVEMGVGDYGVVGAVYKFFFDYEPA